MAAALIRIGARFERETRELVPIDGWRRIERSGKCSIVLPDGRVMRYQEGEHEAAVSDGISALFSQ